MTASLRQHRLNAPRAQLMAEARDVRDFGPERLTMGSPGRLAREAGLEMWVWSAADPRVARFEPAAIPAGRALWNW